MPSKKDKNQNLFGSLDDEGNGDSGSDSNKKSKKTLKESSKKKPLDEALSLFEDSSKSENSQGSKNKKDSVKKSKESEELKKNLKRVSVKNPDQKENQKSDSNSNRKSVNQILEKEKAEKGILDTSDSSKGLIEKSNLKDADSEKDRSTKNSPDQLNQSSLLQSKTNTINPALYPFIPIKEIVVFPNSISPIFVTRDRSVASVKKAIANGESTIVISHQKKPFKEPSSLDDIGSVGVIGKIIHWSNIPDGGIKLFFDGHSRVSINKFNIKEIWEVHASPTQEIYDCSQLELEAMSRSLIESIVSYSRISKRLSMELVNYIKQISDISVLCDVATSLIPIKQSVKQQILSTSSIKERLQTLYKEILLEMDIISIESSIQDQIKSQIDKNQKEYYLNEQMKAIKKELGEHDNYEYYEKKLENIKKNNLSGEDFIEKMEIEIKRIKGLSYVNAENSRIYLDTAFSVPHGQFTKLNWIGIQESSKVLDESHYGLDKVKERILEYLALQSNLKTAQKGSVLCLIGPPGVGKTSLVRTIAKVMGRKYIKIELAGLRDEAEIRGHRRTYVGSKPGKIADALIKSKVMNPVILLDELDKVGSDHRGDPASALLEALDGSQNSHFSDNYLEFDLDLSSCLFICTANSLSMPEPLRDRLDIVHLSSYLPTEKYEIFKKYIFPKKVKDTNCENLISISNDAIRNIIDLYTKEAGVREAERICERLCRKAILQKVIADEKNAKQNSDSAENLTKEGTDLFDFKSSKKVADQNLILNMEKSNSKIVVQQSHPKLFVDDLNLPKLIGSPKYTDDRMNVFKNYTSGCCKGLAYTSVGGVIMPVESAKVCNGKGEIKMTGKLGEVMKESTQVASSLVKSLYEKLKINEDELKNYDIHLHCPDGATPKDGPSAGITITVAIISLITNIKVKENLAMTGEITLNGTVLTIGGLREKLTAALKSNVTNVIIPSGNISDLDDIPKTIVDQLNILPCKTIYEVLDVAFEGKMQIQK